MGFSLILGAVTVLLVQFLFCFFSFQILLMKCWKREGRLIYLVKLGEKNKSAGLWEGAIEWNVSI
jgi:hypothetical protein